MKWAVAIKDHDQLKRLSDLGVFDVILGIDTLSASFSLGIDLFMELALSAKKAGHSVIVLWDALMTDEELEVAQDTIRALDTSLYDSIRVKDFGALGFLKRERPSLPLQLILETGHHSFGSVVSWVEFATPMLKRIILSVELPISRIKEYKTLLKARGLECEFEIMALGPILLFYTPRKLLSYQIQDELADQGSAVLSAMASNEEECHSSFRIIENSHGTLVYHSKDYCLIDRLSELKDAGIDAVRVDTQFDDATLYLGGLMTGLMSFLERYSVKVTRCFAQANATTVLFSKLKNHMIQRKDQNYIGEVVDFKPGSYTVIRLGRGCKLSLNSQIKIVSPERRELVVNIDSLRDIDLESKSELTADNTAVFGIIPYVKRAPVTSMVYGLFQL